jgi:Domain of unknown function (DUF4381)
MTSGDLIEDFQILPPPWWTRPGPWLAAGAVILLALGVWAWSRRRPKPEPVRAVRPGLSFEAEFLGRLEGLRNRAGVLDAYQLAIECSELLRQYLEAAHSLQIRYQTTREFLTAAAAAPSLSESRRGWMGRYLGFCDQIKFARQSASADQRDKLLDAAGAFLSNASVEPSVAPPS